MASNVTAIPSGGGGGGKKLICVKRKLTDEPAETLVVETKKGRIAQDEEGAEESGTASPAAAAKKVLHRVATLKTARELSRKAIQDALISKISTISNAPSRRVLKPKDRTAEDVLKSSKAKVQAASTAHAKSARERAVDRRRVMAATEDWMPPSVAQAQTQKPALGRRAKILAKRDAEEGEASTTAATAPAAAPSSTPRGGAVKTKAGEELFQVYQVDTSAPAKARKVTSIASAPNTSSTITCNMVPLVSSKLSLQGKKKREPVVILPPTHPDYGKPLGTVTSPPKAAGPKAGEEGEEDEDMLVGEGEEEDEKGFVYDYYYVDDADGVIDFASDILEFNTHWEEDDVDQQQFYNPEDPDSNDEGHYANDYPDEEEMGDSDEPWDNSEGSQQESEEEDHAYFGSKLDWGSYRRPKGDMSSDEDEYGGGNSRYRGMDCGLDYGIGY